MSFRNIKYVKNYLINDHRKSNIYRTNLFSPILVLYIVTVLWYNNYYQLTCIIYFFGKALKRKKFEKKCRKNSFREKPTQN